MKPVFAKLARSGAQIPVPGARRLFMARGETVDAEAPFWRRLIADGDIVVVGEDEPAADSDPTIKAKRKG